jgi:hypothetical protein
MLVVNQSRRSHKSLCLQVCQDLGIRNVHEGFGRRRLPFFHFIISLGRVELREWR